MTSAWIQVEETRGGEPLAYNVRFLVSRAYGVPVELFVMRADDGTYSHVATVDEVANYPDDRNDAIAQNFAFFRAASATLQGTTREAITEHQTHVRRRLTEVTLAWDDEAADLAIPGSETYTLGGDL